ncbi:MAG: hypothetical protein ABEJ34_00710 [Haloferacaceae archaeon]
MDRPTRVRVRAPVAVAGAASLAGCAAGPRGAGIAFGFVAVVGLLFSIAVVAVVAYMFVRLASTLLGDD